MGDYPFAAGVYTLLHQIRSGPCVAGLHASIRQRDLFVSTVQIAKPVGSITQCQPTE